jgi:putative N6-adenine-specific DNA methylase
MHHPEYRLEEWLKVRNLMDSYREPLQPLHLFGSDINRNAVRACKINFKAAGFKEIEVVQSDLRDLSPTVIPDFILTNPPHVKRLEEVEHLVGFYRELGDFLKRTSAKPGRGFIFTGNLELTKEVGLAAKRRYVLSNGGVESRLLEFDLY